MGLNAGWFTSNLQTPGGHIWAVWTFFSIRKPELRPCQRVSDQLIDVKVTPHLSESEPPCCIETKYLVEWNNCRYLTAILEKDWGWCYCQTQTMTGETWKVWCSKPAAVYILSSLVFFKSQLMEIKFIQINYRWGAWKDTQSPNGGLDKWFKMMGSCQSRIDI